MKLYQLLELLEELEESKPSRDYLATNILSILIIGEECTLTYRNGTVLHLMKETDKIFASSNGSDREYIGIKDYLW